MVTLTNSEDPDEMQHNAFHQGLHCFAKIKTIFRDRYTSLFRKKSSCDPLQYTMGSPILIVSICMGKSIRIQRVNTADLRIILLTSS